jgi:hypothetical protein
LNFESFVNKNNIKMSDSEVKIAFKSIKKKNMRQRKKSSDEEGEEKEGNEIEAKTDLINETKERQKLRQRANGVNA